MGKSPLPDKDGDLEFGALRANLRKAFHERKIPFARDPAKIFGYTWEQNLHAPLKERILKDPKWSERKSQRLSVKDKDQNKVEILTDGKFDDSKLALISEDHFPLSVEYDQNAKFGDIKFREVEVEVADEDRHAFSSVVSSTSILEESFR